MADAGNDRSSVRRQRLLSDIDLIMRVCTEDINNPFCRKLLCFSDILLY